MTRGYPHFRKPYEVINQQQCHSSIPLGSLERTKRKTARRLPLDLTHLWRMKPRTQKTQNLGRVDPYDGGSTVSNLSGCALGSRSAYAMQEIHGIQLKGLSESTVVNHHLPQESGCQPAVTPIFSHPFWTSWEISQLVNLETLTMLGARHFRFWWIEIIPSKFRFWNNLGALHYYWKNWKKILGI